MASPDIAALVNLLGWTLGFALYAMLLVMSYGSARADTGRGFDSLPLLTALLGLLWNAGALLTHGWHEFGGAMNHLPAFVGAVAHLALGFLPAVVVHSSLDDLPAGRMRQVARSLIVFAYSLATLAAIMHLDAAFRLGMESSRLALRVQTAGLVLLLPCLLLLTRGAQRGRRAVWAVALAVFAVSALHLSTGIHPASHDRWYLELIGHHASLPLALAVLYQDYRFAFADLFLKRALALLLFAALACGAFVLHNTVLTPLVAAGDRSEDAAHSTTLLLALWVGTGLLYPAVRSLAHRFVESFVLRRMDYDAWRADFAPMLQQHENAAALLDETCARLAPALSAIEVRWRRLDDSDEDGISDYARRTGELLAAAGDLVCVLPRRGTETASGDDFKARASARVMIPTAEEPRYEVTLGKLAGGRRVLSDDIALLDWVAMTVARRIDALRVTHERCEQERRAEETAKLATEAQLRALRAQINPHFLFNALTTVGYLIQTSPARALETLLRLTDLLRRVLRETGEWTTLGEELKLVEAYLDIERARFEERLRVSFDVSPELRDIPVPSLVLQPLVENAVKHGIAPARAGGEVRINARLTPQDVEGIDSLPREPRALIITIEDTGAGATPERLAAGKHAGGMGLANVEQRLRLCCGESSRLNIEIAPGAGARVELCLPARHTRRANAAAERGVA